MAPPYLDKGREHRRKALKIQRSLQEKDSLDPMSGSDVDDVDFTKEIHPIGHFIDDRERMIEEMFSILKGEKLQRILPVLLKDYTMEELKADCLVHLLGMSKKRIFAILEGKDLDSSSDSETEAEAEETDLPKISHMQSNSSDIELSTISTSDKGESRRSKKRKLSAKEEKNPKKSSSPCIVISSDEMEDIKPLKEERRTILKLRKERRVLKAKIERRMKKTEKRKLVSQLPAIQAIDDSNDEPGASKSESEEEDKGKSLLEILELEMRARAIRALLKNTPNPDEPVPVSILNIKPEQSSGVETEINKTIAEVIDEKTPLDKPRDLASPTDDVEISEVNDILTVTIDDDDEIDIDLTLSTELDHEKPKEIQMTDVHQKSEESDAPTNVSPARSTSADTESLQTTERKCDDVDEDTITWSERWAQSKGVTDVLKSNKLCANIRKRMRFARMLREKQSLKKQVKENGGLQEEILSDLSNVEESSVAHYELIKSLDRLKSVAEKSTSNTTEVESSKTESMADDESSQPRKEASESVSEKLPTVEEITKNDTCDIPLPISAKEAKDNCIDGSNADILGD